MKRKKTEYMVDLLTIKPTLVTNMARNLGFSPRTAVFSVVLHIYEGPSCILFYVVEKV